MIASFIGIFTYAVYIGETGLLTGHSDHISPDLLDRQENW